MAQDSGSQNSPKAQEVNLDELEVEILVLCKNASALNSAAAFLTRRGWPTTVMTNLSKAIEYIAEKKPDFVLVSLSHPSPSVFKLPDLITQTFNLSSVCFIEAMDTASQNRLNNFKVRYKIQGSPSGPNLHRSIRKILAEKFNIKTEGSGSERAERQSESSGVVTVKGNNAAERTGNVVQSSARGPGGENKTGSIGHMPKNDGSSVETKGSNIGYMPNHAQSSGDAGKGDSENGKAGKGAIGYMPPEPQGSASSGPGATVAQGSVGPSGARPSAATPGGRPPLEGLAKPPEDEVVSTGKYTMSKKGRKSLKDLTQAEEAKSSGNLFQGEDMGGANGGAPGEQPDLLANLKKSLFGESGLDPDSTEEDEVITTTATTSTADRGALSAEALASLPPAGLLERAVEAGLRQVCARSPGLEVRPLERLTKVAVFSLESSSLSGYLVVGVEQSPDKIEDLFLKSCERAFLEQFKALKVPAQIGNGFWVHVPEVVFTEWIANRAEFQIVVPHEESEVGVAFFPTAPPQPKVQAGTENEMYSISIDEISTEQPINFKAYLHLKKNNKYFLYLRNGRRLQPEQKERLKENKVNNIFMKGVDMDNLKMFLAASYLRESIKNAA